MKVKELIDELRKYDQEAEVILSADEEGNYYSPLEGTLGFGEGKWIPENTYTGEYIPNEFIGTEEYETEKYEDNKDIAMECIVLYPTN